ncbi:WS/DGAT domain-containing protein [Actinomycetospora lutea]|uniref:WS/DGAT domain-containing protein n=1 Tax=Actinomycetospora lutea TaxID=663604 RepID=UPI002365DD43|nr:WS/DGAT domain-containing protein [Actinomycetospora lutea]MDD7939583.1 WS/DGAT domain-containing protein [Actinomycetospora lutea]
MARDIPMSGEDGLWLRLDRSTNVLGVVSVLWTATPVDLEALRRLLAERVVARYPVFRCRPVSGGAWFPVATWEDDPAFDLDRHVLAESLPRERAEAALQERVGELRSTPLDLAHPPWTVHLLQGHGPGSAVVVRSHHALADGVRMTRLLFALLDPLPGQDDATRPVATHGMADPLTDLLAAPRHPLRALAAGAGVVTSGLNTVVDSLQMLGWANPRTAWTGPPGTRKTAAWSDPVALELLAGLAHAEGATVNDVCLALLGGALARAHADAARAPTPSDLAWMVPVNLEPLEAGPPERLGNRFALVLVVLPLRGPFRARLAEVHARVERLRHSWEPLLTRGLQQLLGRLPDPVATTVGDYFAGKAVGVLTNVPGPRRPMTLAGAEVTGIVGWAPCSGDQVMTACIVSYAGHVRVGFGADDHRVGDAQRLVAAFRDELRAVVGQYRAAATPDRVPTPRP